MNIKNLILSSVIAGSALLAAAGTVNAATVQGKLVEIYSNSKGGGTETFVYIQPLGYSIAPAYVLWARTSDPALSTSIASFLQKTVQITTALDARCQTTGVFRYCGTFIEFWGW